VDVGISTPGIVDPERGSVTLVPNIPGWSDLGPAQRFGELTGKTVVVENNVNAAMEGSTGAGRAGRGFRGHRDRHRGWDPHLRQALPGLAGTAGEIGLQRKFRDDEPLDGAFGPFERRASGVCIAERYRELAGEALKAVNRREFSFGF
jgi:predicted NBD/HSP70 family sugar kinase